jgi:Family of unknown function (DUF5681)
MKTPEGELVVLPCTPARNSGQWQRGQSGNPAGRPRGARALLSERVLRALADDFKEHGPAVVTRVRQEAPQFYLQICASLIPREFAVVEQPDPLSSLTTEELAEAVQAIKAAIAIQNGELRPEQLSAPDPSARGNEP